MVAPLRNRIRIVEGRPASRRERSYGAAPLNLADIFKSENLPLLLLAGAGAWLLFRGSASAAGSVDDGSSAVLPDGTPGWTDAASWIAMMRPIMDAAGLSGGAQDIALACAGVESVFGTNSTSQPRTSFNFWNVQAGGSWGGPVLGGTDHDAGGAAYQAAWRVYGSPAEALADWMHLIQGTYPSAWAAMQNGDLDGFAAGLLDGVRACAVTDANPGGACHYHETAPARYSAMLTAALNTVYGIG